MFLRIYCEDRGIFLQDCDNDGEAAAGPRLLHLMEVSNKFPKEEYTHKPQGSPYPPKTYLGSMSWYGTYPEAQIMEGTGQSILAHSNYLVVELLVIAV